MPLSFGVPFGLVIVVMSIILFFATKQKKMAKIMLGVGMTVTLMTLILIVLAVNSQM